MSIVKSVNSLSDTDLLARVRDAVEHERHATAQLLVLLSELDARKLYLSQGCSSLFTYCTQVLRLSEHAAYGRIEAARAARKFPVILQRLEDGTLTLTAVGLLRPHLTAENYGALLDAARHKSKHETDLGRTPLPAFQRADITPLAPERYKIQLTISGETHRKLRQVQDLLRHRFPNGDLEAIFEKAVALLLESTLKAKSAECVSPRGHAVTSSDSRNIPAAVRRDVWRRDAGRCAFKGTLGRCTETGLLEFHHVIPFAAGGEACVDNIELRCRAHNAYEAHEFFGDLSLPP